MLINEIDCITLLNPTFFVASVSGAGFSSLDFSLFSRWSTS